MGEVRLLLLGTKRCLWESHRATEFCDLEVRAEELLPPSSQLGCSRVDAFLLHPSARPTVCLCWHRSPGCLGSSSDSKALTALGPQVFIHQSKRKKKKADFWSEQESFSLLSFFHSCISLSHKTYFNLYFCTTLLWDDREKFNFLARTTVVVWRITEIEAYRESSSFPPKTVLNLPPSATVKVVKKEPKPGLPTPAQKWKESWDNVALCTWHCTNYKIKMYIVMYVFPSISKRIKCNQNWGSLF